MNMKVNEKQQNIGVTSSDIPARRRAQTPPVAKQQKPIAPQSDPFTDALREATDADSDVERANSGRVRREGVKDDDGLAAQDVSVPEDGVRSDTSQNASTASKPLGLGNGFIGQSWHGQFPDGAILSGADKHSGKPGLAP